MGKQARFQGWLSCCTSGNRSRMMLSITAVSAQLGIVVERISMQQNVIKDFEISLRIFFHDMHC